jgi:hypothetical protein
MSSYPVAFENDFALERSRLTTFFRHLLAIPQYLVGILYCIAMLFAALFAWVALLITGRYPQGLYDFNAGFVRWSGRLTAYVDFLTDAYPPFDLGEHPEYPVRIEIAPPQASYSRLKVLFRWIIGIPVALIWYALGILAGVCAFLAWFVIVFTGRQSEGLQNGTALGVVYGVRAAAYFLYLTEDWPPFSPEGGPALGPPSAQTPPS